MFRLRTVVIFVLFSTLPVCIQAQTFPEQEAIISVERIWDRAQHSAFTSLVYFNEHFYCAFREGSGHIPGINGTIRIIASKDGQNWMSVALLSKKDRDLRDPMLSTTPDNRLMLNCGGSFYQGKKLFAMQPLVSFSDQSGSSFSLPEEINIDLKIKTNKYWLWRTTWHKGVAYAAIYQPGKAKLQLVKSSDGLNYELLTSLNIPGFPTETTLRFTRDDKMIAVVRRDAKQPNGFIGTSVVPYKKWTWRELDVRLGGPDLLVLDNGRMICATRAYQPGSQRRTILGKITEDGFFARLLTLPGNGDCSYPGLLVRDDVLYVSYYSSHEEKTAIYFARVWLDELKSWLDMEVTAKPQLKANPAGVAELSCDDPGAEIYYTLDGGMPVHTNSDIYSQPIQVTKTTILRAIAYHKGKLQSKVLSTEIGTAIFQKAQALKKQPAPGLAYAYFAGRVESTADINKLDKKQSGICTKISIEKRLRDQDFAFVFNGFIRIPQDGIYTFFLRSNDGSVLTLNDAELINNDGPHASDEIIATTSLRAGFHKIRLDYFQMGGGKELRLLWKGADFGKTAIPAAFLFH